ncbi:NB-ARC domain-containing protein [Streptomyces sp. NBC_00988]|uniref:AfsR/SARP family transcriptional regulator n=1 Tax=Streptomyces sp. NBC_00988 TaxID=2903704 RepID=UPI003863FBF1|nr:NB-ARC domain-containing protein [Streptomyces sp. NBC_00988]
MELKLLGPVEARPGTEPVPLGGTKIHTVLAALLLNHGSLVSDSQLSTALWGCRPPTTRSAQIYTYASRLRKHLGPEVDLVRLAQGYLIRIGSARLDLDDFQRGARLGREALDQHRYYDASTHLRSALALWQGPALANVTEHLAERERPSLEEARLVALEHRIEADLALGRHRELVPELTGLTGEHPLRERLRAQLMAALYRCDRQADALGVFHTGRLTLADELGVDPGPVLTGTYQAILRRTLVPDAQPAAAGVTVPRQSRPVPAMLPPQPADFAGRGDELQRIRLTFTAQRGRAGTVLLTGMPGIGKSTLAVRAAHDCREDFPDGQLYADLRRPDGSPRSPWEVLSLFLRALGVAPPDSADLDELVGLYRTHTAGKRLLVILDRAVGGHQITPLLPSDPGIGVIVTSRTHLAAVSGGTVLTVPLLTDAEALDFLGALAGPERIRENPEATRTIIEACAGLPLALRISGMRLAVHAHWSTSRLARRLSVPQTRLEELSFGELDVEQRLLSSLMGVSPQARQALPRLTAIPTPRFPAEAAALVLGAAEGPTERLLDDLVEARLLEVSTPHRPQYSFHELVRLFALTLPGPAMSVRSVA